MVESTYVAANCALKKANAVWVETLARATSLEFERDKAVVTAITEVETLLGQALSEKEALIVKIVKAPCLSRGC